MAGTALTIVRRMRSLLGADAVVETDRTGSPRIAPGNEAAVAVVLRTAAAEGWRVRVEGAGSWMPPDGPGDLVLSTRALSSVTYLNTADLVATADAGISWEELRRRTADHGAWIAADPPGERRTLGSVVATGTAGPLRTGFGTIRDHLLGLTFVSGDGRVIRPGGRVVKNVAGFDLTKLVAGSFGAFGVVTSVHLRLRAVPRADLTLVASGSRDGLLQQAQAALETGMTPAALELLSPGAAGTDGWVLALRLSGAHGAVEAQRDAAGGVAVHPLEHLPATDAARWWHEVPARMTAYPVTVRMGTVPGALDEALDLVAHHLPDAWLSATVSAGSVRWSGSPTLERLRLLRYAAAQHEMPLTLERAPWDLRRALGHFGAYREGVSRLVGRLRRTFDPAGVLVAALGDDG